MCGIAGAVGVVDPRIVAAVERAHAAQAHRGPDAEGLWLEPRDPSQPRVMLAHKRLSILDLSPDGNQPMHDRAGHVVVFNGEIYNFQELRQELESTGARFTTRSDTEVLLAAYAHWGDDCVEHLRGMFAFALYDPKRRTVLLARDRLGEKPLYWTLVGGTGRKTLLFASELRSLLATDLVERRIEPRALATYLWNGCVHGRQSLVAGVQLLPAGTRATVALDEPQPVERRFWCVPCAHLPRTGKPGGREELRAELQKSVRLQLASDVPLGVFLSGGIDSSAVASLAVRSGAGAVRTFTIGFEEAEYDESDSARAVAQALGTQHEEIRLDAQTFGTGLEDALGSLDQPTFDAINTYFVSRAVRRAGITVALAGTGGDELFGGYRSFQDVPRARLWACGLAPLPAGFVRGMAVAVSRTRTGKTGEMPSQTRWGKLEDALATRGSRAALYQVAYALWTQKFLHELAAPAVFQGTLYGLTRERFDFLDDLVRGVDPRAAVGALELESFVGQRLLRDADSASMAVSLEVRVPLLDARVVEAASALDPDERFEPLGRKQLLRDLALDNLDPQLFERPKSGFVLPIERWCRASLRGEVGALLEDAEACRAAGLEPAAVARAWRAFQAGAPGLYWSRVWSLYVLLWWCRRYRVSI